MTDGFLIVHQKILPSYLEKVIEARNLLESGEVSTVTEAVQKVGISRNTYYKYKYCVFTFEEMESKRKAVITLSLNDQQGVLSAVLSLMSNFHLSVLTISQAVPLNGKAKALFTLDISHLKEPIEELLSSLEKTDGVLSAHLAAME